MDGKATVKIGEFSRGGLTRGDNQASDHDRGLQGEVCSCGIVDEESAELTITFGSSAKRVTLSWDVLETKWTLWMKQEKACHAFDPDQNRQWSRKQWQAHAISPSDGAARRRHSQADSAAVLAHANIVLRRSAASHSSASKIPQQR